MFRRQRGGEEGQVIPALLLTVVAILFFGLLFAQVGSAAEQKTQTQTATDSGAVAATHRVRDFAITSTAQTMVASWTFGVVFAATPQVIPQIGSTACNAARINWNSNPHGGADINCNSSLSAFPTGDGVRVDLLAPAGQVVTGPADASEERAEATAVARVVLAQCPGVVATPIQRAIANWLVDESLQSLGVASDCFTAGDNTVLVELEELFEYSFGAAAAAIGPPPLILDAVRGSMRVERVDD